MNRTVAPKGEIIPPSFTSDYTLPDPDRKNPERRPRHIFIFLDGTWNEERTPHGLTTPTNVLRMFQEMNHKTSKEINSSDKQKESVNVIAHYFRGVGSRQDNKTLHRNWFGFSGKDEERIRNSAFAGLYRDYNHSHDFIYILGFSRGAASARLLARDICIKGFPSQIKVRTTHFPNLLTGQIEARVDLVERLDDDKNHINYRPRIAFLGCWDTVDAFVLPSRFPKQHWFSRGMDKTVRTLKLSLPRLLGNERFRKNENEIPEGVQKAVHCVAIDETRNAFLPTLMPHASNVEEVWFPGVHADIGGGYDDNTLADGPYNFMKERLSKASNIPMDILFKNGTEESASTEFCFHFHGLNTGLKRIKGIFGFGAGIRRVQVLGAQKVVPKIHNSLYRILNSKSVFAADALNKPTWAITYDPYNVRQLKQEFEIVCD